MSEPERPPAPIDPKHARELIQALERESPLVHNALRARDALGWSEADTFAMLAYFALDCLAQTQKRLLEQLNLGLRMPSAAGPDQINLAAMLDKTASEIARGAFGDVSGCSVFLQGTKSNAIVTLPIEEPGVTAAKFRRAVAWCETGELPS